MKNIKEMQLKEMELNDTINIVQLAKDKMKNCQIDKKYCKDFLFCILITFVCGVIAHSYMFLHSSFSHDSLFEFVANHSCNAWRINLGRVFVPIYRIIFRGAVTSPWLIGILSLFFIGIAVFFVTKIFNIRSKTLIVLISGIFATNITVIATASTYLHDLDTDMLALALSVFSVYLWKKYDKGFLYGIIPLCLSIGFYQSYISVTITLILLYLIMQLLNKEKFMIVFKKGMKSIVMIISGGILYFISTKLICSITNISLISGNYNSIDTVLSMSIPEIVKAIIDGYIKTCYTILNVQSAYPRKIIFIVSAAMIAIAGIIILRQIFKKEIKIKEKVLTIILIFLLPISMNIVYPLTGGMTHDLMHYAIWLTYLFILIISWWALNNKVFKNSLLQFGQCFILTILVLIILCGNVQIANVVYLKKDLEHQANLSLFTRILYQIENYDNYVTGETPIVFVGKPNILLKTMSGLEYSYKLTGNGDSYALGSSPVRGYYESYFNYVLLNPAIMADNEIWLDMQSNDIVKNMPCYPAEGSISMIDSILVIKLGN